MTVYNLVGYWATAFKKNELSLALYFLGIIFATHVFCKDKINDH